MSRCKKWLCCCVSGNKESDFITSTTKSHTDHDYLLPGGEWDPSISVPPNLSHSTKKKKNSTKELFNSLERDGLYQPPAVVPSPTLPTFDDFKLLKTVGRGAFGKVSLCSMLALFCYKKHWEISYNHLHYTYNCTYMYMY